ncbi:type II secretion system F family protein [Clostridium tagluense]|uniref:type II secretion system F family protein n=1 Tax=Clostridium tagluense TaxID=360422 RepID=UPI001CF221F3|nr:type II secretion system F family protein [Clostridium tagluense]MCB2312651.1 type II secretion system F family protein [Clostridium tagluense]MCB2317417.1 type II secretion system F family protein [Clostridium tagluense]MCB2322234.1 type II secretion system F family protein [Clostridium tagluense]MCB2327240.1 type II secretion system F family protein [Clostridium tagluense]MCB2331918.1 type II secretion system F family protein [Clostridium tagluense]
MITFKYKVMNQKGEKIEGTFKANSKNEVLAMIEDNNYYPIEIKEVLEREQQDLFESFSKVKTKDLYIFCRQFHTMINAGANISNALDVLRNQTANKKLKKCLNEAYDDVQKGISLSEALGKHNDVFPDLLVNMINTGEVSGNLDIIMSRMASHFEKENKINNQLKSAMVYPMVLAGLSVVVVVFLLTFIMPTFVGMFEGSGVELPAPTRIVMGLSKFIRTKWYILLVVIGGGIYGMKTYAKTPAGRLSLDGLKLKLPIIKDTTEKVIVSRFTRTLATVLASGVSLVQALDVVQKVVGNKVAEKNLGQVKEKVLKGVSLGEALGETTIFPVMLHSMIKIGEESGSLDDILDKTANFYDEELEAALKRMTTMIEPLMIIIMGVLIGFIVIAMMLPMFDMFKTVQ